MFSSIIQKTKLYLGITTPSGSTVFIHKDATLPVLEYDDEQFRLFIYDTLKTIKDPEKDATLEDLNVIREEDIHVHSEPGRTLRFVRIEFTPTVPHCSLAALIGLCIRIKFENMLGRVGVKVKIYVKPGTHNMEQDLNKQINDKERVAAAMENENLKKVVEKCIKDVY